MGPFVKRIAFFSLLGLSYGGISQAQPPPPGSALPEQESSQTVVEIDAFPLPTPAAEQVDALGRTYETSQMTGPLVDAGLLFSSLDIENDFRDLPAAPLGLLRMDAANPAGGWLQQHYAWVTPTFYHQPLVFEQVNLERYGIGPRRSVQPVYSAAHFFGSIGLLPYKLLTQHPCERVYTLGHNRPGDCVPFQRHSFIGQSYPFEALRYFHDEAGHR